MFGTNFPTTGRTDMAGVLRSYFPPVFTGPAGDLSELLRLNLAIDPTPPAASGA